MSDMPIVPARDIDMPELLPATLHPGVAYVTRDGFSQIRAGRTDQIREECRAAYRAEPSRIRERWSSGRNYPAGTTEAALIGQVVDVLIEIRRTYRPSQHDPPASGGFMYQGTWVENNGDYGITR